MYKRFLLVAFCFLNPAHPIDSVLSIEADWFAHIPPEIQIFSELFYMDLLYLGPEISTIQLL